MRLGHKYDGGNPRYGRLEEGWQFSLILLLLSGQSGQTCCRSGHAHTLRIWAGVGY